MLEQTRNQMAQMKLNGMLQSLDLRISEAMSQNWGVADFISALVTDENSFRQASLLSRRIRAANFRTQASFDTLDLTAKRNLTKPLTRDLMQLHFIKASVQNLMITGPTGVGKTFLATAIGNHACRHGHSAIFMGITVFMEKMMLARSDGTYLRLREKLIKTDLLIIDDIGLKKLPALIVQDLHDLLEERQEKCTLITTQLPLNNWSEIIDDELALDTVVDKLQNGTMHIVIEGESYRKKRNKKRDVDADVVPVEITNH